MTRHLNDNSPQVKIVKRVKKLGNAILVSSGLTLLIVMVTVTLPKLESLQYHIGTCKVKKTFLNMDPGKKLHCRCEELKSESKCLIYYPCLQIYVSFDHLSTREVLVVNDRRRISETCSYKLRDYDCKTKNDVYKHVERFREKWGLMNSSYHCFHTSRHPDQVTLANEAPSTALTVNLTLFPCIGIAIGLLMLHFKEQIGLILARRLNIRVSEGYVPVALVKHEDDSTQNDWKWIDPHGGKGDSLTWPR